MSYPNSPGHKGDLSTGRAAAVDAASTAETLRTACLHALHRHGNQTADEIADRIGKSVLAIRPRISELRTMGKVAPTNTRRPNASGKSAVVWALSPTNYTQPQLL